MRFSMVEITSSSVLSRLFKNLNFQNKKTRDKVLGSFHRIIKDFKIKNKLNSNLEEIYNQYVSKNKKHIKINNFIFKNDGTGIMLYNSEIEDFFLPIIIIKSATIIDGQKKIFNEWIISIGYLQYILKNVYCLKYPKFAHSIDSMKSDKNCLFIKDDNIFEFLDQEWNVIFESPQSIDYEKIKNFKYIRHYDDSKSSDKYFSKLIGIEDNSIDINDFSSSFSLSVFFEKLKNQYFQDKIAVFHNEEKLFKLKFIKQLENLSYLDNREKFGYLYINFELLKKIKNRRERLEYFAYCLLSLFPYNYKDFQEFIEEKNTKENIDYSCESQQFPIAGMSYGKHADGGYSHV